MSFWEFASDHPFCVGFCAFMVMVAVSNVASSFASIFKQPRRKK